LYDIRVSTKFRKNPGLLISANFLLLKRWHLLQDFYKLYLIYKHRKIMKPKTLPLTLSVLMTFSMNVHAQSWTEVTKVVASDREYTAWFGSAVGISGHTVIVGAYQQDDENADQNFILDEGAAYLFEKDGSGYWLQKQKITASDKDYADWFGSSVGISGDYVIVGAYVEDEDTTGSNTLDGAGSVYIFKRNGYGIWTEVQKIVPSDRNSFDYFGFSSAISGNYALVGAILKDIYGAAYVFERDGQGIWHEIQRLNGDYLNGSEFGYSVSIDGDFAIIGAPYERIEDDLGVPVKWNVGAAYIFQRDSYGNWNRINKLVAPNRDEDELFGISVSLAGNYAIVGSNGEEEDEQESDSLYRAGAAYIYEKDGSNHWNLVQKIVPSDRASYDEFGFSVSISGNIAAIGAPINDVDDEDDTHYTIGSVYLFERNDSGVWEEITNLLASDWDYTDQFGMAVALSGNYLISGAIYESEDANGENTLIQAGSAYVFSYCSPVENHLTASLCKGDSLLLGGDYQSSSGTFYDTLRASTGCDSVMVTELNVIEVDTAVYRSGDNLTAAAMDASYQWIDCGTGLIIPGETDKNYTPTASGNFSIEVTQAGCIDTSCCHPVTIVGIVENNFEKEFTIYPNPAEELLLIKTEEIYQNLEIRIMNLAGKSVISRYHQHQQYLEISLENLSSGLYFIQLKTPDKQAILKVLKE
jgi:hypothetical protein